jgi:hypothetical protein
VFRSVFGDAAMMTRVRPAFMWQSVNLETGLEPLIYLEDRYIPACIAGTLPALAGVPKCPPGTKVSDLLYGTGGSAYYYTEEDPKSVTLANLWSSDGMDAAVWGKTHQIANSVIAHSFGLKRVAYEGGPHFNILVSHDDQGHRFSAEKPGCPSDVARMAAWSDPRMKNEILEHHAAWSRWDGDLLIYSGFAGGNEFGFIHDVLDVDARDMNVASPKMAALQALAGKERAPIALGSAVPATVTGKAFDLGYRSWYKPGTGSHSIAKGEWASYLFKVAADGPHEVGVTIGGLFGGGAPDDAALLVDGAPVPLAVKDKTAVAQVRLARGLHSVRVRAERGDIKVKTVSVTQRR